ncbi:MAG: DUF418 domain-containing protein [Pseudomonadota bacterium]
MTESAPLHPVAAAERIEAMDVLRGVALLGILLMNIEAFVGAPTSALTGLDPSLTGADRVADAAVFVLVQGKFYLLFSLLFGMGFAVMMARANAAGRPFFPLYLRRTLALLAIGLAHLLLIWSGDILTMYALIALPLLLIFRTVPWRQLPYWAAALYLLNVLALFGMNALGSIAQLEPTVAAEMDKALQAQAAEMQRLVEAERAAYGAGTYLEAVAQRARDAQALLPVMLFISGQVLGMFVLGAWFVGSGAIARPEAFPRFYRVLRWIALPIGLVAMLVSFRMMPTVEYDRLDVGTGAATSLALLAALPMCLGYVAWILRGLESALSPVLRWVAPAGRMALTNYLGQSLICTLIFYGYGLGAFERLPRLWQIPFAFALFAAQVAFSRWWMARYRFGPAEWLWRAVTYRQWPPMRRSAAG